MQLVNYVIIPEKIPAFQSFNWLSIQESAPRGGEADSWGRGCSNSGGQPG